MKRKRHSAEQIIPKLREAEVLLQKGQAVPQVCRQLAVTAQTYYPVVEGVRWHAGGRGQAAEGSREGEYAAQEDPRRAST